MYLGCLISITYYHSEGENERITWIYHTTRLLLLFVLYHIVWIISTTIRHPHRTNNYLLNVSNITFSRCFSTASTMASACSILSSANIVSMLMRGLLFSVRSRQTRRVLLCNLFSHVVPSRQQSAGIKSIINEHAITPKPIPHDNRLYTGKKMRPIIICYIRRVWTHKHYNDFQNLTYIEMCMETIY